jgi:hypothetical protein
VFYPRSSNGRRWVGGIALITFILCVGPFLISIGELPAIVVVPFLLLAVASTAPLFVVAWYVPDMRYKLDPAELRLRLGPLMNDRIPLQEIRSVEHREKLKNSLLASFRFPGLAVFDVDYLDVNRVQMCATSASRNILLIDTTRRSYGVTPANEAEFLDALGKRLNDPAVIRNQRETISPKQSELTEY